MPAPANPCVALFALGGTIAMTRTSGTGVSPALSAADLLAAVPGLGDVRTELRVHDVRNTPGASLTFTDVFELGAAIASALEDGCTGAVVTQGTDTIEEVAYALDLLLPTDAPVVAISPKGALTFRCGYQAAPRPWHLTRPARCASA
jgi:L-asparaginase